MKGNMVENNNVLTARREFLRDESETLAIATRMAQQLSTPLVVYLHGELGAGKTAFCRGLITALGHQGAVKSPTYTLVEPYSLNGWRIHHFDLYRLADPEELEYMGIRDYFAADTINLIEWPERGEGWLPAADVDITLSYYEDGRVIELKAKSEQAKALIESL